MKNSYFHERLNDKQVVEQYIEKINTYEIEMARILLGNIYMLANDHPKFSTLLHTYQQRLKREQDKKE